MEIKQEIITMLHMLPQPAFLVENGVVCHTNAAAGVYLISREQPIELLLADGMADYAAFSEGSLYLGLHLGGSTVGAAVTALDGCHLFTLEQPAEQAQLQGMALAAQQIRGPLSGMLAASETFLPTVSAQYEETVAQFQCRVHQLLRRLGNMSDALHYAKADGGFMEYTEVVGFVEEILEKAAALAAKAGFDIQYSLPREMVCTVLDREKVERSLLNMLSNAMKYAPQGGQIQVQLRVHGKRLYLSVIGNGEKIPGDVFTRFCRQPMLEDPSNGLGLGMVLIRSTALAHGGAVWIDQPKNGQNRITLSLPIRRMEEPGLRTPVLHLDYAGGYDHCLLELSDILPPEVYQ